MPAVEIDADDPRTADVRELLARHLAFTGAASPPEDCHALDLDGLLEPGVTFYSCRAGGELLAIGALKELDARSGEIKSMHTSADARRRGLARLMLDHLIGSARLRGWGRLSLETGTMEEFAPARALYESAGFRPCAPFGDYRASPNSTFMTLPITPRPGGSAGS